LLKPEDNERLVRVGRGKPAGELFRRYWLPVLLSTEIAEVDGPPLRVRLLGENLIAFRDTNGRIGLVDAYCPHRLAPLFFGRNEECGIRCAYHGWKFDVDGNCLDTPSEPGDTALKSRIRITAYPTLDRGGIVWAYLGPREEMPPPPDYEWLRAPATHRHVSKTFEHCNYLQALEGGLDTSHSSFVHNNNIQQRELRTQDTAPRIEVERTDYGYTYNSTRNYGGERRYMRIYHFVMPSQQMRGGTIARDGTREKVPKLDGHIWVPIDDEHTFVYNWACSYDETVPLTKEYMEEFEAFAGRGQNDVIPGTFRLRKNLSNDYLIDRKMQKSSTFTGITGLNTQDFALQEGMGPIVDRSKEHLGTSDRAIVVLRRILLDATHAVERGERPRGIDPAAYRDVRPCDKIIAGTGDWRQVLSRELVAKW
jgi:phenylpropionate dioxygenase-like ring-hydroxylating dioxygenase large terminal subunit